MSEANAALTGMYAVEQQPCTFSTRQTEIMLNYQSSITINSTQRGVGGKHSNDWNCNRHTYTHCHIHSSRQTFKQQWQWTYVAD